MRGLNFETLQKLVFSYYGKCKYEKALDIARIAAESFPEKQARTSYWRACLYSLLGRRQEAISILKEANNQGIWWSPTTMLQDDDLKLIKETNDFKQIIESCRYYEEKARLNSVADLLVIPPSMYDGKYKYPLLFSIHWRNGNAQEFSKLWSYNPVLSNFVLAFPQSSQISGVNEYSWDDEKVADKDIQELFNSLLKGYSINHNSIIVAGASQGGKLALDMALKYNSAIVKGFIIMIPALTEFESYIPYIKAAAEKDIRGCIITGDQDYYYSNILNLSNCFRKFNFPCKLITVSGMGHFFPDDYEKKIKIALDYIIKN